MNLDKYFEEDIIKSLSGKMDEVKNFLKKDNIKITSIYPDIDDFLNLKNGIHKSFYEISDDELKIYVNDEMIGIIKEYINKNALSLDLPETLTENLDLKEFKNLKSLSINNDSYSHDYMTLDALDKIINETNLKSINITNGYQLDKEVSGNKKYSSVSGILFHANYDGLNIESDSESIIGIINIKCNNLDELKNYINYLKDKDIPQDCTISIRDKDYNDIMSQISIDNGRKKISIQKHDIKEIDTILSMLDINLDEYKVNARIENKTYDGMDEFTKKYNDKNIFFNYGVPVETSSKDFANMRHTIDYFKSLVPDSLSPIEKTMQLYDIVKTFEYNESSKDTDDSRYISNIFKTGNIVCVGYSSLLSTLLKEEGIKASNISISSSGYGHARVLVKIDDNKYNIHGLYVLDPTWDSKRDGLSLVNIDGENYIKKTRNDENNNVVKDYDVMSSYQYFMIPFSEYNKRFPEDSEGTFICTLQSKTLKDKIKKINDSNNKEIYNNQEIKYFFGDDGFVNYTDVKEYVSAKRIPYEDLTKCLMVVKKAEGYGEDTEKAVRDSIEVRYRTDTVSSNEEHLKEMLDNEFNGKSKTR